MATKIWLRLFCSLLGCKGWLVVFRACYCLHITRFCISLFLLFPVLLIGVCFWLRGELHCSSTDGAEKESGSFWNSTSNRQILYSLSKSFSELKYIFLLIEEYHIPWLNPWGVIIFPMFIVWDWSRLNVMHILNIGVLDIKHVQQNL